MDEAQISVEVSRRKFAPPRAPRPYTVEIHTISTIRGGGETWGPGINTIMKKGLAMASRPKAWLNSELNNLYEKNFIRREGHV